MGFGKTFTRAMTLNDSEDFLGVKMTSKAKAI